MTRYLPADDRYESMTYRRCGRSGLLLPAVSLGLWQNFGDDQALDTQRAILRRAFDLGRHPLRPGQQLRPPLRQRRGRTSVASFAPTSASHRDELVISTKAGWDMWPGPTATSARASTSWPASTRAFAAWASTTSTSSTTTASTPTLRSRRPWARSTRRSQQGKALYVGISSYSAARTREAVAILRRLGTPLLIHQPSYSMLNRWIEGELLDVLGSRRRRLHRLLPAGAGPAHRPLPQRRPGGLPRLAKRLAVARHAHRGQPGAGPRP